MSIVDAAHRLALRYPGGITALAARMGKNANSLAHKLAGQVGHNLFATECEEMTAFSRDPEIAQALAHACGHVCVPVTAPALADADLAERVAAAGKEFGDVMNATLTAIADNRVTQRELAEFDRQFNEHLQAMVHLRAKLASMVPPPPTLHAVKHA